MIFLRLLGLGAAYGVCYMFIKSLFPEPFILLTMQSKGHLSFVALTYMGVGLVAGLIAAPLFGSFLLWRGRAAAGEAYEPRSGMPLILSLALTLMMGLISAFLILAAYYTGFLPPDKALDPLRLIQSSVFPAGPPVLVAWTFAREQLPADMTGLFLAPVAGKFLLRLYAAGRPPLQKAYDEFE